MTAIDLQASPSRQGASTASTSGSRQTRLNQRLAIFLALFVALAPVPLGGARPLFWSLSATIIAVMALLYGLSLWRRAETFRVSLSSLAWLWAPWAVLLGFLIVQTLPLASFFGPFPYAGIEGQVFHAQALSLAPGETTFMLLRMAGYGCFFFLAAQAAANRDRALQIARWLSFIVGAHALYGLVALTQFGDPLLFVEKWAYQGSATGTFVNRNSYATFLAVGFVISVGLAMRTLLSTGLAHLRKGQRKPLTQAIPHLVAALVILAALFASESRMGLFAGLCGAAALTAIGLSKGQFASRKMLVPVVLLLLTIIGVAVLLFSAGTFERLGSVERDSDVRLQLYAQVLEMIQSRWATGFGGGSFELAYTLFHRDPVSPDLVWHKAHSSYLTLWSELGVFAGSLPIIILAILGFMAARLVMVRQSDWWLPLISLSTLIVVALHSLVDFSMEISGNVYLVLLVLALGTAQRSNPSARQREPGRPA